jgi:hypothetical protein
VYELLFRSRWYALVWALFMATSAILFTTTGASAWWSQIRPDARATEEARETEFRSWVEDDKRKVGDGSGYDPSSPERVRDGFPPQSDELGAERRSAPFAADDEPADGPVNQ